MTSVLHRCPFCGETAFDADKDVVLHMLHERATLGVTTLEIRQAGVSGNPSERRAELKRDGIRFATRWEKAQSGRRMKRYWLAEYAPGDAVPDELDALREEDEAPMFVHEHGLAEPVGEVRFVIEGASPEWLAEAIRLVEAGDAERKAA